MATFNGVPSGFYLKSRPNSYEAEDAAYAVGGNPGMVLARYPKDYPNNSQQEKVAEAADACGIEKGISKKELQNKMKNCIPGEFEESEE